MASIGRYITALGVALSSSFVAQGADEFDIHSDFIPTLRDARIDGTLYFNVSLCTVDDRTASPIWPVTLKHILEKSQSAPKSVITLRGFRTSLAPYGATQYVWSGPSGQDLALDISRQRRSGATCRAMVWALGDDAMIVTDSGWRLYYEGGYLRRAITASGFTLRFYGRGPVIERITSGSIYAENELLQFGYSDPVTPTWIHCREQTLTLTYHAHSINKVESGDGSFHLDVTYKAGLIAGVTIGKESYPIQWTRVPPTDFSLSNLNPYGIVLKQVKDIEYKVSASQTTVTVSANAGAGFEKMVGNNYSHSVKYEVQKR